MSIDPPKATRDDVPPDPVAAFRYGWNTACDAHAEDRRLAGAMRDLCKALDEAKIPSIKISFHPPTVSAELST